MSWPICRQIILLAFIFIRKTYSGLGLPPQEVLRDESLPFHMSKMCITKELTKVITQHSSKESSNLEF